MRQSGKRVTIIGAGINGLVAANYLARAGFDVTVLERKNKPGGACCAATTTINGVEYTYPQGASVLGMMQDFVFEETGLSKRVRIQKPTHPPIVYSRNGKLRLVPDDRAEFVREMKERWGERGKLEEFLTDMDRVVAFLRKGFRDAIVPTVQSAEMELGKELVALWITGSAKNLLDHYLTSDPVKLLFAISTVESGPVSFDSPYSAFSIPLMASGGVFDGAWGYVRGGIWQIPLELEKLNVERGVRTIYEAQVTKSNGGDVYFMHHGKEEHTEADYILFATDPLSAAHITGETAIIEKLSKQNTRGAAGKLVMLFAKPVEWSDDTGLTGFDAALRDIVPIKSMAELEQRSNEVITGAADVAPVYLEIFCEGAGDRELGGSRPYDMISVYFNAMTNEKSASEMEAARKTVTDMVLAKIRNPGDLLGTVFETPKDLMDIFFFPGGNIDHIELAEGQTFSDRGYSSDPAKSFYQFGADPKIFYCAAGTYPCGSVAGTPGYMCAMQLINSVR